MKSIHTVDVRSAINNYSTNPITANRPPPTDRSEQELPRRTRVILAQLRSGWCHITNHYMSRINPEIQDICPNCGIPPYDVHQLFNCPRKPTTLEITSLWTNPREAAIFLHWDTEGNDEEIWNLITTATRFICIKDSNILGKVENLAIGLKLDISYLSLFYGLV